MYRGENGDRPAGHFRHCRESFRRLLSVSHSFHRPARLSPRPGATLSPWATTWRYGPDADEHCLLSHGRSRVYVNVATIRHESDALSGTLTLARVFSPQTFKECPGREREGPLTERRRTTHASTVHLTFAYFRPPPPCRRSPFFSLTLSRSPSLSRRRFRSDLATGAVVEKQPVRQLIPRRVERPAKRAKDGARAQASKKAPDRLVSEFDSRSPRPRRK